MKTREQQYIIWSPPTLRTTGIQNARQMHFQKYPTNQPIIAATVKSGHLMGGVLFGLWNQLDTGEFAVSRGDLRDLVIPY